MTYPIATNAAAAVRQAINSVNLRQYQQQLADDILRDWDVGNRNVLGVMPTGAGKCLGKGTPILMYDGSIKPVEDVEPGDSLMGPDSNPRTVLTLARGREVMYKVTPVKGEPYVVNESHVLSLKQTGLKSKPLYDCQRGKGDIVNLTVKDYISKSKHFKHTHKGWRSPVSWGDKTYDNNLPPYMLGLWLGDGTTRTPNITTADVEIVDYINSYVAKRGFNLRVENMDGNASSNYHISNDYKRDGMCSSLRSIGVLNNKHIPLDYKTGSDDQRLELLAGLLDSDGHYDGKSYDVVFKLKRLADDLVFVARSLGFAAYVKPCRKKCYNNGVVGNYHRISISGDFTKIPTKLSRNKFKPRLQKKSVLVTGIKVEKLTVDDYYGFEITGDRLFMLGDFTVTHNTVVLSYIVQNHNGASCVIAHRQELTSQISIALARNGIRHRILGPDKLIRMIVSLHMVEIGVSFYDPSARCAVAGVDTIMSRLGTGVDGDYYVQMRHDKTKWLYGPRENGYWGKPVEIDNLPTDTLKGKSTPKDMKDELRNYAPTVTLWVTDEAHHCAANGGKRNKWMKATDLFINAKGLGVTATPCRADGAGLGRHHDGVFDSMVIGPTMRYLIDNDYLTEYRIFAPPSDIGDHMADVDVSKSTGDFNVNQVRDAIEHSSLVVSDDKTKVVGDVVKFYLKKFKGKLSVVFVPSVSTAKILEKQFIDNGVQAKALDGTTPDQIRNSSIRKFAKREISVLINVALFDEGFDLPAIEVVQDAYPTQSYGLFSQRFGRMLRLMDGKKFGIYSDHAGNVKRHGLPDAPRTWSLDRREKRGAGDDVTPLRTCMNEECFMVYERYLKECPHCGTRIPEPSPSDRGDVEFVDGDLFELDADTLAQMRGDIEKVDKPLQDAVSEYRAGLHPNVNQYHALAHVKRFATKHETQQTTQTALRGVMAEWAGYHRAAGRDDSEIYRRFYLKHHVDWYTAMTLDSDNAMNLIERTAMDIGVL